MEITITGECIRVGGFLYSSSYLFYSYGLADIEIENDQCHLKNSL